jgi:hypothetical protein
MATLTSWNGESDRDGDDLGPMAWTSLDCARGYHDLCKMGECECDCHEEPDENLPRH